MNRMTNIIILAMAILIFVSFFLPWVDVQSQAIGKLTKVLRGEQKSSMQKISGFQVPVLANSPDSKLMISLIQLFNPGVKDADKKSYLIWGIPILALMIAIANYIWGRNKWFCLAMAILGIAIFAVAVFKIKTTDLDKGILNVQIAGGLWLTLSGYLGIGLCGLANFLTALRAKDQ